MNDIQADLCFKEMNDFLEYCKTVKNSSEQTLYNYFRDLLMFFRYMKFIKGKCSPAQEIEGIPVDDIDISFIESINIDDIYRYFDYLKISRSNSQRTCIRRATSLKMFFKYLHITMETVSSNPTEKLELPAIKKQPLKFMDEKDCITLLNSIDGKNKERDYCILVIFINCGVRLSELVRLNDTDIQPDGTVTIRGRNTSRVIYFNKACMEALDEYNDFKEDFFEGKRYDHHAVFIGKSGKRLTGRWIEEIVKKRMKKAGFGDMGISPNKLRHTAGTIMYRRGIDVSIMKDILGHKDMSATQIYALPKVNQIENAMKNNSVSRKKK
ncbi:MAG: tyrosine-type recombinase/integrase [Ruminococcus flavefaciens]|nr:tyrosine-type recombinase/integrase [Ruminococcus flavefaciens]